MKHPKLSLLIFVILIQHSLSKPSIAEDSEWSTINLVNRKVNSAFTNNDDINIWGVEDYWATPKEFIEKGQGDCEDFVIMKYFSLIEKGISKKKLLLSYVIYEEVKSHMVLLYQSEYDENEWFVLDSLVDNIFPTERRSDLKFIYSFNEAGIWTPSDTIKGTYAGEANSISKWHHIMKKMNIN